MTKENADVKILYVDDDEFQREMLSMVLARQGFKIKTAWNGQEGVEIARNWLPDLILMDIMMPVMDGLKATQILRAGPPTQHIPILAITAVVAEDTLAQIESVGMDDILPKPISLPDILQKLQAHLPKNGASS